MSTTLKQKMAGRLSGSLKSTEDRLAKADAVMASGGLLQPRAASSASNEKPKADKKRGAVSSEPPAATDAPSVKVRVQRETFTMLPVENEKINEVRTRAAANKFFTNRSAVIRAGIMALDRLNDEQLVQVLGRLPVVKPGRG